MDIIRRFLVSGRPGIYLWYYKKARLEPKTKQRISREKNKVTVKDIVRLYVDDKEDIVTMRRAARSRHWPMAGGIVFGNKSRILQSRR